MTSHRSLRFALLSLLAVLTACGDGPAGPPSTPPITVTTTVLPAARQGTAYTATLEASNAAATWSLHEGELPAGLSLDEASGTLSGTPTVYGTFTFTVEAAADGLVPGRRELTLTVRAKAVVITTETLPDGAVGVPYSAQFEATGGAGDLAWTFVSGQITSGLALNAATGVLEGVPGLAGSYLFEVRAEAADDGQFAIRQFELEIAPPPLRISTTSLPDGAVGVAYEAALDATGGAGQLLWSLEGGTLPAGLTLNAGGGTITGTPTEAGAFELTVRVTATEGGAAAEATLTLTVGAAPASVELTEIFAEGVVVSRIPVGSGTWVSRDTSVVRVVAPGRVMAWSKGATWVVGELGGVRDSAFVRVTAKAVRIGLDVESTEMALGGRLDLTRTLRDANGRIVIQTDHRTRYTWSSSDVGVVQVSEEGRVTAVGPGEAEVAVSFGGVRGSVTVKVEATAPRFAQLATGVRSACGLTAEGELFCWGLRARPYAAPEATAPVAVRPDLRFTRVDLSDTFGCALTTAGRVLCWGEYRFLGRTVDRDTCTIRLWCDRPVEVAGGTTFASIHLFINGACGIAVGGGAWCWGVGARPNDGQAVTVEPVRVEGTDDWVEVAGTTTDRCGRTATGVVSCWGRFAAFAEVETEMRASTLSGKEWHLCALDLAGAAWCWGLNEGGGLGLGDVLPRDVPTRVLGDRNYSNISVGWRPARSCAVTLTAETWCWGDNRNGALGVGTFDSPAPYSTCGGAPCAPAPVRLTTPEPFTTTAPSEDGTCALTTAGTVYCWGKFREADGTEVRVATPTRLSWSPAG